MKDPIGSNEGPWLDMDPVGVSSCVPRVPLCVFSDVRLVNCFRIISRLFQDVFETTSTGFQRILYTETWQIKDYFQTTLRLLLNYLKGTLSPHKKISYMKHIDPLSTKKHLKNSSEFLNRPKNALKVLFSVLN